MSNIQARLRTSRYSEQYIKLPTYNELKQSGLSTSKLFTNKYGGEKSELTDLSIKMISLYSNPPVKDRYFKTNHKQIVDDYLYVCNKTKHYRYILLNKLIIPLAYYLINKDRYDTFEHYGISWINNAIWHMRKYIIKIKTNNKVFDRVSPKSNGIYPLYKPMTIKSLSVLRDTMYNLLIDITLKYIKFHLRNFKML